MGFRKVGIDRLKSLGVDVRIQQPLSYRSWLAWLRTCQVFFHDESDGWNIDGTKTPKNCAFGKDIEVASQGCFVLRDSMSNDEFNGYCYGDSNNVPLIKTFESYEHCVELLFETQNMRPGKADDVRKRSVEFIRNNCGWNDIIDIIEGRSQPKMLQNNTKKENL